MSYRDSTFTYVHMDDLNQVLYMEKWQDDPIPFDDIDTQGLFEATSSLFPQFLLEDEEDGGIPINSSTFGAKVYKNRSLLKEKVWTDLGIYDKFIKESSSLHKQSDKTILKSINTKLTNPMDELTTSDTLALNEFLSNGYATENAINHMLAPSDITSNSINAGDLSITSASDYLGPGNNTFILKSNLPSGSTSQAQVQSHHTPQQPGANQLFHHQQGQSIYSVQTPRVGRTRQLSTDKNLQTPITRIVR
ncbi:hypothetical protein HYPBUDRAFT_152822 [Hyphopichia burtonii NRRL Y-1933]|uniref:Uncharacterized protein n=1 Tax=Hyphopichia burtonii NRRL Y-1933 TaxID=984485 RepID=A0A1E4RLU6_9ASCO|nr:hypothetical protein HYPBUDRAFT_152822 [Hyphopichia burtonii NRRL Y-1933]ODV68237.1 hypothetical protein HYPBUDRAFT_152822 [Hyphopichia burtonii NRRL Y-1933]